MQNDRKNKKPLGRNPRSEPSPDNPPVETTKDKNLRQTPGITFAINMTCVIKG